MFVDLVASPLAKDPKPSIKLLNIGKKRPDLANLVTQNIFDKLLENPSPYREDYDCLNEIIELSKSCSETEAEVANRVSDAIPVTQALKVLFREDNSRSAGSLAEKDLVVNIHALRGFVKYLDYVPAAKADLVNMLNDDLRIKLLATGFKYPNLFKEVYTILKCKSFILSMKIFENAFDEAFPSRIDNLRNTRGHVVDDKHFANFIKLFFDDALSLEGIIKIGRSHGAPDLSGWEKLEYILDKLADPAKEHFINFRFKMEYLSEAIQFYKSQETAVDLRQKNLAGKTGLQDFYQTLKDIRDRLKKPLLHRGSEKFEYEEVDADGTKTKTVYCNNILTPTLAGAAIQTLIVILGENNPLFEPDLS
jgi:hypothetical protein